MGQCQGIKNVEVLVYSIFCLYIPLLMVRDMPLYNPEKFSFVSQSMRISRQLSIFFEQTWFLGMID